MLQWVKYLTAVVALLKIVPEFVDMFEVPGYGTEKKSAVLNVISNLYDAGAEWVGGFISKTQVLDLAEKFIDGYVAFKNAVGAFTHKTTQ
jgi:hypothetical protein